MLELLQMWAMIEVLGLVCLPLTITVFHNMPDRGWAFSKTLGLALFAFCVWFPLMCLQFLPFSQLFIAGVALILLAGNLIAFLRVRHALLKMIRSHLAYILVAEIVFLGMVFLLGFLRSYGPGIRSYEMFMDEGFIASIMRSPHLPPNDMWFSGYSINYYYYAHFTVAMLAKLLGQSPSIAFNTGICMFFGLTAINLFGVTCNIVSWARYLRIQHRTQDAYIERPDTVCLSLWRSVPYGLLSMLMGLVLGNLAATQTWWQEHDTVFTNMAALQQWLHSYSGWAQYDWFAPSRVVTNTINEFPAFSFLLSCFHAHVLTLAFTIMAMGMAFNLFLEIDGKGIFVFGRGWRLFWTLFMTAIVLGGLFAMNGWDYPTYLALVLVCIVLQQWLAHGTHFSVELILNIITAGVSIGVLSFILYFPFYHSFVSPAQGIGIVNPTDRSQLRDELLIYGLFAFVFLSLLLASALRRPLFPFSSLISKNKSEDEEDEEDDEEATPFNWQRLGWIGAVVLFLLGLLLLIVMRNGATFVIASSIALLGAILLFYNIGDRSHAFTLLLGATAFALVATCEVIFLKDVFAGSLPRMNTVFKLYFQAWAMLSIGCGAGLFFILDSFHPLKTAARSLRYLQQGGRVVWIVCLLGLILAGIVYPLSAPEARYALQNASGQFYLQRTNSLDGLTYLATDPANPGDYDAIRWLNANVQGDPVIVEAVGDDYSNAGRVSAFTGLPTPMGWIGHEIQWRINWFNQGNNAAEYQRRAPDIDTIYKSPDATTVLALMAHYNAQYLYVGPVEYAKYSTVNLHRFSAFMQVVYNAEGVTIYKVR